MRVRLTSIAVDEQAKAPQSYTEVLGCATQTDMPAGGGRWIAVVPPDEPDGPELVLEPSGYDFATAYRRALYERGMPYTALASDDVQAEYEALKAKGVEFTSAPSKVEGFPPMATFD